MLRFLFFSASILSDTDGQIHYGRTLQHKDEPYGDVSWQSPEEMHIDSPPPPAHVRLSFGNTHRQIAGRFWFFFVPVDVFEVFLMLDPKLFVKRLACRLLNSGSRKGGSYSWER